MSEDGCEPPQACSQGRSAAAARSCIPDPKVEAQQSCSPGTAAVVSSRSANSNEAVLGSLATSPCKGYWDK